MWRRISHVLHVLLYFGFPVATATVGVYLTYRATQLNGSQSIRAYCIGIGLILGTWAWTAARTARHRAAAEANLEARVRDLETHRDKVQRVLDTHAATAVVLEAVECPHDVPPWPIATQRDTEAPVIRMDPPGR